MTKTRLVPLRESTWPLNRRSIACRGPMTASTIEGGPKRPHHRALRPRIVPTNRIKCGAGTSRGCRGRSAGRSPSCIGSSICTAAGSWAGRRMKLRAVRRSGTLWNARCGVRASSTRRGCCMAIRSARSRARPSRPCWAGLGSPRRSVVLVSATTTPGACPARSRGAEALFRALKYSTGFPRQGFTTLAAARDWVHAFADGYNTVHRHRGIQYVTPPQRYSGEDVAILRGRHALYHAAQRQHPARWSGDTHNWVTFEKSG